MELLIALWWFNPLLLLYRRAIRLNHEYLADDADKHVPNFELNKYTHSDIAEYDLSKLYGAALKGRSYKYQLNIMTNEYFDKTYEERVNNRVLIARRGWFNPKGAPKREK